MLAEATTPPALDGAVGILSRLFASGPQGVAIGALILWLFYDVASRWIDKRSGAEPAPVTATVEAVRTQVVAINQAHLDTLEDHETRLRHVEDVTARLDERTGRK